MHKDLATAKQAALDAIDDVLSATAYRKGDKITALRELQATAKRMADNIEGWTRDAERQEEPGPAPFRR
jgi:hypothetical protein